LLSLSTFAGSTQLPAPYRALIEKLLDSGESVSVQTFGGNFKGVLKKETPEGFLRIEVTDDDFLSFYAQLYEVLTGKKPPTVSLKVDLKGKTLPYNPFYQLWDYENGVRLLKFSKLKPGCAGPVVEVKAAGTSGARVKVPFSEVLKFFEGGFKYPAFYCF